MGNRKGFTFVELMVVILIVGILAAIAVPIIRGRIDSARWSEGKAAMGTIAESLRIYSAEKGINGNYGINSPSFAELGFTPGDFQGRYFNISNYEIKTSYEGDKKSDFQFTITATAPAEIKSPSQITLNEKGDWKEKKQKEQKK